jgi:hypothetical protein
LLSSDACGDAFESLVSIKNAHAAAAAAYGNHLWARTQLLKSEFLAAMAVPTAWATWRSDNGVPTTMATTATGVGVSSANDDSHKRGKKGSHKGHGDHAHATTTAAATASVGDAGGSYGGAAAFRSL